MPNSQTTLKLTGNTHIFSVKYKLCGLHKTENLRYWYCEPNEDITTGCTTFLITRQYC